MCLQVIASGVLPWIADRWTSGGGLSAPPQGSKAAAEFSTWKEPGVSSPSLLLPSLTSCRFFFSPFLPPSHSLLQWGTLWGAYVQLVPVFWQEGVSCNHLLFSHLSNMSTSVEAAHLSGSVSLRESWCDILVSQLMYNFVCKCRGNTNGYLFIFVANDCSFFSCCVIALPTVALWDLCSAVQGLAWHVWKVSALCCEWESVLFPVYTCS